MRYLRIPLPLLIALACSDPIAPTPQPAVALRPVPSLSVNAAGVQFEPSTISSITLQPQSYPTCQITLDPPYDDQSDFLRYNADGTRTFQLSERSVTIAVTGTFTGPFYVGSGKLTFSETQRPIPGGWEVSETQLQATGFVGDAEKTWRGICAYRYNPPARATLRIDLVGVFHWTAE